MQQASIVVERGHDSLCNQLYTRTGPACNCIVQSVILSHSRRANIDPGTLVRLFMPCLRHLMHLAIRCLQVVCCHLIGWGSFLKCELIFAFVYGNRNLYPTIEKWRQPEFKCLRSIAVLASVPSSSDSIRMTQLSRTLHKRLQKSYHSSGQDITYNAGYDKAQNCLPKDAGREASSQDQNCGTCFLSAAQSPQARSESGRLIISELRAASSSWDLIESFECLN